MSQTTCKFCLGTIEWDNSNGRWVCYNLDGTRHECLKDKSVAGKTEKKIESKYETQVVHVSADQWDELITVLDDIKGLLDRLVREVHPA